MENQKRSATFYAVIAILVAAILVLIIGIVVTSCSGGNKYTVTFDTRGGSDISSYTLKEGDAIVRPSDDPTKEMFVFDDWYSDYDCTETFVFGSAMPNENITVYANWISIDNVKVTFDANGGLFDDGSETKETVGDVGETLSMTDAPQKYGYVFGGWYTDTACTNASALTVYPAKNTTLYAGWNKDAAFVYVTVYGNGEYYDTVPVTKGEELDDLDIFGDDITVDGWYTDEEMETEYMFGGAIVSDVTLYTAYYTKGLLIENGIVISYDGKSESVVVPSKYNGAVVTEIGEYAFYRTSELSAVTSITLPETVETIDEGAFYDCRYLVTINLTDNVTTLGAYAFYNNMRLKSVGDISAVRVINDFTFTGCWVLQSVAIDSATKIGESAFAECKAFTSMTVPAAVTSIGDYAFSGCTSLKTVAIEAVLLDKIGVGAFYFCKALERIDLESVITVVIGLENNEKSPFADCDNVVIYVGDEFVDYYKDNYGDFDGGTLADKFAA